MPLFNNPFRRHQGETLHSNPNYGLLQLTGKPYIFDTPEPPAELGKPRNAAGELILEPVKMVIPEPKNPSSYKYSEWQKQQAIENLAYHAAKREYDIAIANARLMGQFAWIAQFREQKRAEGYTYAQIQQLFREAEEARDREDAQMAALEKAQHKSETEIRLGELAANPPTWPDDLK